VHSAEPNRNVSATKTFLRNAMKNRRTPTKIPLDRLLCASRASHRALRDEGDRRTSAPQKTLCYLSKVFTGALEPIVMVDLQGRIVDLADEVMRTSAGREMIFWANRTPN